MKNKFIILTLSLICSSVLAENTQWIVSDHFETSLHSDGRKAIIITTISANDLNRASIAIDIKINDKSVYSFESPFWERIDKAYAAKYIKYVNNQKNVKHCNQLEPLKHDWADVNLEVTEEEYKNFKESGCKIFIHQTHYENWRTILFPINSNNGIIVNNYGV